MTREQRTFLEELIRRSGPTGSEQRVQRYLRDWAEPFADRIEPDLHGNLGVVINPSGKLRVMIAAHCDVIGFMVMDIDEKGCLRVEALGGIDEQVVLGERVVIATTKGDITGVFGKTASHNQTSDERSKVPKLEDMWIDIGARDQDEARELVSIGDYVTFQPRVTDLCNGRIAGPGLDNRVGVWAIMETARRCAKEPLDVALHFVSSVQEEIGSRGVQTAGNRIHPDIAIAVDTTLATDDPGKPKKGTSPRIKLDGGPSLSRGPNTNPMVAALMLEAADRLDIPTQREANVEAESNDASEMQVADAGAAAISIGIPIRNMHTQVEVASLRDLEQTADLLTEFLCSLRSKTDFRPIAFDGTTDEVSKSGQNGSGQGGGGGGKSDHAGSSRGGKGGKGSRAEQTSRR
jgi:endoglucanase